MKNILTYINFVRESSLKRGILFTFKLIFWELMFDRLYGVETFSIVELSELQLNKNEIEHGKRYQASNYYLLALSIKSLEKCGFQFEGKISLDLGSGKGRALIVFAEKKVKKSIGVEISYKLNEIAQANSHRWLKKHSNCSTEFQFITSDASTFKIPDTIDLIYIANPFDEIILKEVVMNIKESYNSNPRELFIVYMIPIHKDLFLDSIFNQVEIFKKDFIIYKIFSHTL